MQKRGRGRKRGGRKASVTKPGRSARLAQVLTGVKLPPKAEAEFALRWCYGVTRAGLLLRNKGVDTAARKLWFNWYRPRFQDAIIKKNRHFKDDILSLSFSSSYLAERAAFYAGANATVTVAAAQSAIKDVTCASANGTPSRMLHWCPP
jgi:hypothetical protein